MKKLIIMLIIIVILSINVNIVISENETMRNEIIKLKLLLNKEKTQKIPVLLYHHIIPQKDMDQYGWNNNSSIISLENFKDQMKYLYDNNYHTATLDELVEFMDGHMDLPKNTVLITFDDGYLSNTVNVYPVMKQYAQKGVIFMGNEVLRPKMEYDPKGLQFIHLNDLNFYTDVFEYGCHTFNMHQMKGDKSMLQISSYEEIKSDLLRSREVIGAKYIAYPFGQYSTTSINVIRDLDFKLAFTVKFGYVYPNSLRYELPRIIIGPKMKLNTFIKHIK